MSSDTESNVEQQLVAAGREGNQRRYAYATLAVLGLVAIFGTAMVVTSKTHGPTLDHAMVSQMIQKSQTHKVTRLLSSTCQGEMEKKMISAMAVALLKEAVCKGDDKQACGAFTRVANAWEDELTPPCAGGDLKCTLDDDSVCVHPVCLDDINAIPADERPTCE